jgi:hypothetical protein
LNKQHLNKALWLLIALLSVYYLYRGIKFRFFTDGNLTSKSFWYYSHLATAIAPLILGPFQFWTWLRLKHVYLHRTLGKIYLAGSLLGGALVFVILRLVGDIPQEKLFFLSNHLRLGKQH